MVHTGQNFTPELRDFFFKDLKLRKPDYELDIDTSGYGAEVAGTFQISDWWRLRANYSFLQLQLHKKPGSNDPVLEGAEGDRFGASLPSKALSAS